MDERWKRAYWIAEELGKCPEDVYDVLLGNITEPGDFVRNVEQLSQEYSNQKSRLLR
jgi:hypothetical protein